MTYDYLISIKKPDYRFADQVSQLLYVFAIAAFAFFSYQSPRLSLIYLVDIAGIGLAWAFALAKKNKQGIAYFRLGLLVAAVGWVAGYQRNILMAILYALAGILEKQVKFPPEIGFSASGIYFNSFPAKTTEWSEVNNVVIKDGLITIDKKDNKLYQKEIEGFVTTETEDEFNQFCRNCLDKKN